MLAPDEGPANPMEGVPLPARALLPSKTSVCLFSAASRQPCRAPAVSEKYPNVGMLAGDLSSFCVSIPLSGQFRCRWTCYPQQGCSPTGMQHTKRAKDARLSSVIQVPTSLPLPWQCEIDAPCLYADVEWALVAPRNQKYFNIRHPRYTSASSGKMVIIYQSHFEKYKNISGEFTPSSLSVSFDV